MASKRTLVFATMLFGLLELGFTQNPPPIKATGKAAKTITAGYYSKGPNMNTWWHGVRARVTLWDLTDVQPLSSSGAYIAAINQASGLEMIAAGVHVNPSLHNGDKRVHFFTYWTSTSDYSTGCYNTLCPGFVVAEGNNLYPGEFFDPPHSTYGGEQRGIELRIKKDEKTGDWSLYREDLGGPIGGYMRLLGWWPGSLFKSLSDHAETIQWTGVVTYDNTERAPPMGSGRFASELNRRASSFTDCFGFDAWGKYYDGDYHPLPHTDKPSCYDVSLWYHTKLRAQRHFFFGGPGGCAP